LRARSARVVAIVRVVVGGGRGWLRRQEDEKAGAGTGSTSICQSPARATASPCRGLAVPVPSYVPRTGRGSPPAPRWSPAHTSRPGRLRRSTPSPQQPSLCATTFGDQADAGGVLKKGRRLVHQFAGVVSRLSQRLRPRPRSRRSCPEAGIIPTLTWVSPNLARSVRNAITLSIAPPPPRFSPVTRLFSVTAAIPRCLSRPQVRAVEALTPLEPSRQPPSLESTPRRRRSVPAAIDRAPCSSPRRVRAAPRLSPVRRPARFVAPLSLQREAR